MGNRWTTVFLGVLGKPKRVVPSPTTVGWNSGVIGITPLAIAIPLEAQLTCKVALLEVRFRP
jgi:hypothetical protein